MNNTNSTNTEMESYSYIVSQDDVQKRVDLLLSTYHEINSRTMAQRLLKQGLVKVNNQSVTPSYKVRLDDHIQFILPSPEPLEISPEVGNLDIIFEDQYLIVINKPAGQVVHPSPGHSTGTLVNHLSHHCQDLSGIGGMIRPGIVHRIDKDTTGVLVVAKTDLAHHYLSKQFRKHSIHRKYKALIWGNPLQNKGSINAPIGRHPHHRKKQAIVEQGKPAITHWKVVKRFQNFALLDCQLETGRTHQIRVHLSSQNMPLLGDLQYGNVKSKRLPSSLSHLKEALSQFKRQALHAHELGFLHPDTQQYMEFSAPLPSDFENMVQILDQQEA